MIQGPYVNKHWNYMATLFIKEFYGIVLSNTEETASDKAGRDVRMTQGARFDNFAAMKHWTYVGIHIDMGT